MRYTEITFSIVETYFYDFHITVPASGENISFIVHFYAASFIDLMKLRTADLPGAPPGSGQVAQESRTKITLKCTSLATMKILFLSIRQKNPITENSSLAPLIVSSDERFELPLSFFILKHKQKPGVPRRPVFPHLQPSIMSSQAKVVQPTASTEMCKC